MSNGLKTVDGRRFKVTADCPKAPFSPTMIASMANQAGISVNEQGLQAGPFQGPAAQAPDQTPFMGKCSKR